MSYVDKVLYKALRVYGYYAEASIERIKKENLVKFRKKIDERTEEYLFDNGLIKSQKNKTLPMITEKGLNELRILEERRIKYASLTISVVALIISFFSLVKSFGFL